MKSTKEESSLKELRSINLKLPERLQDPDFRREWFRAELEDSVPEAFRALRERRGMTQGDLAKAMGTKQPAVSRFERSTSPTWEFDFLLRAAEAMNGRLRVVVEAAEDVLSEYEDRRGDEKRPSSVLQGFAETQPLTQSGRISANASANNAPYGNEGYGTKARGQQPPRGVDDRSTKRGSAVSS